MDGKIAFEEHMAIDEKPPLLPGNTNLERNHRMKGHHVLKGSGKNLFCSVFTFSW